ncbi:non-ribosomal peptide synthetase [Loktanella sp. R86503]|uniref:non-ribosomal peptide synthetase n=1 Tax=Loktanella sp. R86503 TaxID=3093847 RepID=UPI0036DEEB55
MQSYFFGRKRIFTNAFSERLIRSKGEALPTRANFKNEDDIHQSPDLLASICDLFFAQVSNRGQKISIIQDDRRLSYADLSRLAGTIAQRLDAFGVVRGDLVGIMAGRSIETVAAQLAIMALGAAFVPLDPAMPDQYRKTVVSAVKPKAIVCQAEFHNIAAALSQQALTLPHEPAPDAPALATFQNDPDRRVGADDCAYVIFTSGSTGDPKGVMVPHRGICRLVQGQEYVPLDSKQVVLNLASVGFDVVLGEIYSALLNGGTLVVVPEAAPSLDRIGRIIARDGVTTAYITAGLFHIIAEQDAALLAPLESVIPCGDVLSAAHVAMVRRALPHLRIINGYGPTEAAVFTCFHTIPDDWDGGPIPIGLGLNYDQRFVLDENHRPVPRGEMGQLAVGGMGVALGYFGRPDLTDAAFVHLDHAGGVRVYLTGDLVRERSDGVFEFHGRADRQIKINGQRIELDTIEHALRNDPAVDDAAAVAIPRVGGGKKVVAFAIPAKGEHVAVQEILHRLREVLPAAAIPSRLILQPAFPLSRSGKVDRKQLAQGLSEVQTPAPPGPPVPITLAGTIRSVWAGVLNTAISDDDLTFFDHGGTSLQLIEAHALLQDRIGRRFDIALMFQAPRVRALVRLLEGPSPSPAETLAYAVDPIAARRAEMARARNRQRTQ